MKLADYLKANGLTQEQFAQKINRTDGAVSQICKGQTWVSRETALAIMRATDGQVTANDLLGVESLPSAEPAGQASV